MTPERLRAAADRIDTFDDGYEHCFGRAETREHSRVYLRGLLLCEQRKTCEAIALHVAAPSKGKSHAGKSPGETQSPGRNEVQAMQHFLTESPWDYHRVQAVTQQIFAKELAPSAAATPIGVVGVIDE